MNASLTLLLLTVLLMVGCEQSAPPEAPDTVTPKAPAADETAASVATEADAPRGEHLRAAPPGDWVRVYQLNRDSSRISDYVPQGETATEWRQRASFETFANDLDIDPIDALLQQVEQEKQRCDVVQHFNLFSGLENNYPTSVRLFQCGLNNFNGKGEIKLMKAIRGNKDFYLITLQARTEPFETGNPEFSSDIIATWTRYLRRVSVCDNEREAHPC